MGHVGLSFGCGWLWTVETVFRVHLGCLVRQESPNLCTPRPAVKLGSDVLFVGASETLRRGASQLHGIMLAEMCRASSLAFLRTCCCGNEVTSWHPQSQTICNYVEESIWCNFGATCEVEVKTAASWILILARRLHHAARRMIQCDM